MLSLIKDKKETTGRLVQSEYARVVLTLGTSNVSLMKMEQSVSISWICDAYSATALQSHHLKGNYEN
jgi:hypothetical protein